MSSVPEDRFTPHGYLDNPFHTRNLHPSGVIRSSEGVGVAWHYPALARGYGFREVYRCAVEIALVDPVSGGASRIGLEDLHADVHTCNRLRFRFGALGLRVAATFHRIGEHALACRLELSNPAGGDRRVRVCALARYARHLGAAGTWGESGLVCLEEAGTLVVQGFEDGDAFALLADRAADTIGAWAPATQGVPSGSEVAERTIAALPPAEALRAPELTKGDHAVVTGRRGETVTLTGIAAYDVSVPAGGHSHLDVVLARHIRRDLAARRAHDALARRHEALADARTADERFWRQAPALEGDWPDAWRRGFAVDLETLRMMVRSPIGVYAHVWDGMQVHAPRAVLAEAAIDALLLGYADPDIGKALLLGTFLDAPAPNVPCSREDGSYNMVGANGSACGTAPEWGYPVEVARQLYRLAPDQAWLAALYPALARFLRWWLAERCDAQGYLVYDNSWESGQDLSARFGPQKEGGGSTIRMVRPVDLQAAMASACGSMAYFAQELGRPDEAHTWAEEERAFRERTEALWHDGAYRDFDARVGFSDEWDVMQLAPLALGLAPSARAERLAPSVARLGEVPYLWPMFVWTAVDAALQANRPDVAARVASDTVERAWATWDRREAAAGEPLPGVTCEYWGVDGRCGAEGYGWGAFGIHLLVRALLGFRPADGALHLRPELPAAMRVPGRSYRVTNLPWSGGRVSVTLTVVDGADGELDLTLSDGGARAWQPVDERGAPLADPGEPGAGYRVRLAAGAGTRVRCVPVDGGAAHPRRPLAEREP